MNHQYPFTHQQLNSVDENYDQFSLKIPATNLEQKTQTVNSKNNIASDVSVITDKQENIKPKQKQYVKIVSKIDKENSSGTRNILLKLPSDSVDVVEDILNNISSIEIIADKNDLDWANTITDGANYYVEDSVFTERLQKSGSEFVNADTHNGVPLHPGYIRYDSSQQKQVLGEHASINFLAHLRLGGPTQFVMPHSGFSVEFKPPSDNDLIHFNLAVSSDKVSFGRYTYGLVFSNTTSYSLRRALELAAKCVVNTSIQGLNKDNILDHLCVQDSFIFLVGMLAAKFPKGLNYKRGCINNPEKCTYVAERTLNPTSIIHLDRAALSLYQKSVLASRRANSKPMETLEKYRAESSNLFDKEVFFNKGQETEFSVVLKTPTCSEHIDAGFKWIEEITDLVDDVFSKGGNLPDKESVISSYGVSSILRQYRHWVRSINYDGLNIVDSDSIDILLTNISADEEIVEQLTKEVKKYINDSTLAIVGIETFVCPKCNEKQGEVSSHEEFTSIIPLDVLSLFFTVAVQYLKSITQATK